MNEIIVKLAEQAAEHAVLNPSESVLQSEADGSTVEIPAEFIRKLSELIIRECMQVADRYVAKNMLPSDNISEHFGIEP